jgi:hypothetical protein
LERQEWFGKADRGKVRQVTARQGRRFARHGTAAQGAHRHGGAGQARPRPVRHGKAQCGMVGQAGLGVSWEDTARLGVAGKPGHGQLRWVVAR